MRNKKAILLLFVILFTPLCFLIFATASTMAVPVISVSDLKVGDIILYPDSGKLGWLIPGDFSHSAIYVGNDKIIQVDTNGVYISSIPSGSKHPVMRVSTTDAKRQAAVEFALTKLGLPYDYKWLTYIGGKEVNGDSYYCSELCWAAYKSQGIDIDRNPGWSWTYGNSVAPQELYDDGDTYQIGLL